MKIISKLSEIGVMSRKEFEQGCIAATDHQYIGDDTVLCKVLTKHKMYVNSKDLGISPHLMMDGYWESWITKKLAQIIEPGFHCLDIGANFGYFSILMSELAGTDGKTVAIEPNPGIASLLHATRAVNGNKFEIIEKAVSDKPGEVVLTVKDRELGGGTIKRNELGAGMSQVNVQSVTVDELLKDLKFGKVDVIKIDVEGVEPLVFEGMQETLESNPGIHIIMEYSPSLYDDRDKFTEYLFSNFRVCLLKDFVETVELGHADLGRLSGVKDHADLYLRHK